ncbi:MAG: hypothetical protein RBJ76_13510 [Stenomitos frigidus ULC029]
MLHNAPLITFSTDEVSALSRETLVNYAWSWVQSLGLDSKQAMYWLQNTHACYIQNFISLASLQPATPDRDALNGHFTKNLSV